MDPAHGTAQDDENFLQGMIRENEDIDIDVTRTFRNDSGEGDESLNRGDGSDEVEAEAWDGGEADEEEADEGEGDDSGRTLNLRPLSLRDKSGIILRGAAPPAAARARSNHRNVSYRPSQEYLIRI
jgi:hypothetical protein